MSYEEKVKEAWKEWYDRVDRSLLKKVFVIPQHFKALRDSAAIFSYEKCLYNYSLQEENECGSCKLIYKEHEVILSDFVNYVGEPYLRITIEDKWLNSPEAYAKPTDVHDVNFEEFTKAFPDDNVTDLFFDLINSGAVSLGNVFTVKGNKAIVTTNKALLGIVVNSKGNLYNPKAYTLTSDIVSMCNQYLD